ncbi:unnamed protein product [Prorocentrum cordatum]|uniref:Uncharacterized protein n=1 Tax=Prorocentrum cordatum TaxID=2364126 RepID=A0ABN9VG42_9DINO|nr:unnamed protein product [Polarella glacialis]
MSGSALQLPYWHSQAAAKRQADEGEGKGTGGGGKKGGGAAKETRTGHKGLQGACAKLLLITAREEADLGACVFSKWFVPVAAGEMQKEAESGTTPDFRGRGAPHLHVFMALIVHSAAKEKGSLEKGVASAVGDTVERFNNVVSELSMQHLSRTVKHCREQKKKEQADQMATLYLNRDRHNTVGVGLFETLPVAIEAEGGEYVGGPQPWGPQEREVSRMLDGAS